MITILMIALAVVLLLVAVGSLVSYLRETSKYKNTFKKKVLTFTQFCTKGVVNRHYPCFLTTAFQ